MPLIPTFRSDQSVLGGAPMLTGAQPRVNPRMVSQAQDALTEGAKKVADVFFTLAEKTAEADRATEVSRGSTRHAEGLTEILTALEHGELQEDGTRRQLPVEEMRERWGQRDAIRSEAAQGIRNPQARALFEEEARRREDQMNRSVETLIARRHGQAGRADLLRHTESAAQRAAATRDPVLRQAAVEDGLAAIGRGVGWALNEEEAEQWRQRFRGRVDTAEALWLIQNNPAEAARVLADPARLPGIDEVQRPRLFGQAQDEMQRRQARAEAATARRERAIAVEIGAIDNMMLAGFTPEPRLDALREQARGTSLEPAVARLEQDAREVRAWAVLPAAQQSQRLLEMRTRLESGDGSPQDFAHYRRLASIMQAQQQDVGERGLERAQMDGVVPTLRPLDLNNPAVLSERVAAAQQAAAHYGRPGVSIFTPAEAQNVARTFVRGDADTRMGLVMRLSSIEDQGVRAEAFRMLERARGADGHMPDGILFRIADLSRGGVREQSAALTLLNAMGADLSDQPTEPGQQQALNAALLTAQGRGVQGALRAQLATLGGPAGGPVAATLNRDMAAMRIAARYFMAQGMDPAQAVQRAQDTLNAGRLAIVDSSLGAVFFNARGITAAEGAAGIIPTTERISAGLRLLRDRAAGELSTDPRLGQEAALNAHARRAAIRHGQWINEGGDFALVSVGTERPVVLIRSTVREAVEAAELEEQREAREPPPSPAPRDAGPAVLQRTPASTLPSLRRRREPIELR